MNVVLLFSLFVFLSLHHSSGYGLSTRPAVPKSPKCIYFTGAGIYYYWQAGAAKYLKENCDMTKLPIIGASAGALTSTLLLSDVDFDVATATAIEIGKEGKIFESKIGLAGVLRSLVKVWLEALIPEDVSQDKFLNLQISVTPVTPFDTATLIDKFYGRNDLIEACLASCHVPFFFDGNAFTNYRGKPTVDGSFMYFVTKNRFTGLPLPKDIQPEDVFWVDYGDDDEFMKKISGNFLELTTPDGAHDMMVSGYDFMRREHAEGRLPMARFPQPVMQMSSIASNVLNLSLTLKERVMVRRMSL